MSERASPEASQADADTRDRPPAIELLCKSSPREREWHIPQFTPASGPETEERNEVVSQRTHIDQRGGNQYYQP
jgi:hypothetical protein